METITLVKRSQTREALSFSTACENVSLINYFSLRHWNNNACFEDGSVEGVGLLDGKASLLFPSHY